jgi:predicted transcriptional regulator
MATKLDDIANNVVAVVEEETSALVVTRIMRTHHVGALVVIDAVEKSKPVGIVTDRD